MLATDADATIDFTGSTPGAVMVGGSLLIEATDDAEILANSKLVSSSVTSNDGGASVLKNSLQSLEAQLPPLAYTSADGSQTLFYGDVVSVATGHTAGGTVGQRYQYKGSDDANLNLSTTNFLDSANWILETPTHVSSDGTRTLNLSLIHI